MYNNRSELNLYLSNNPFPLKRPDLFPGLNKGQISGILTNKSKEISEITNLTKEITMKALALDSETAMQWFMTRFWPIDYIFKFNDLAERELPNVFINQSELR